MHPPLSVRGLLVVLGVSLAALLAVELWLWCERPRSDAPLMRRAVALAEEWSSNIRTFKESRGLWDDTKGHSEHAWMLGEPYSSITTTLGSREAKQTAANPAFAALLVRWLHDAGVDSGEAVGITLSGSFPALGIATLAAVEVVGARAVLVSSLGSSSYGANQSGATWIDMEHWLRQEAGLRAASVYITPGAEGDSGGGLPEGGVDLLKEAARRTGRELSIPTSLEEGIRLRTELFLSRKISLLVNIGGGQTSLGVCPHAPVLPAGYRQSLPACSHPGRGVIERVAERGIPVIHLLNIRELAHRHGIPLGGNLPRGVPQKILTERSVRRTPVMLVVGMIMVVVHVRKFRVAPG